MRAFKFRKSLRSKFIVFVVLEFVGLSLVSTLLLTGIYQRELERLRQRQVDKMMEMVNDGINVYFRRMNLLFYAFQNNATVKKILMKDSYEDNQEVLEDMETMKEVLKNAMVGEEYIQNIVVISENGMYFSGGGSTVDTTRSTLESYQQASANKEVGFTVELPRDHYSYTKVNLIKEIHISDHAPKSWCVMTVSCRGMYKTYTQGNGYDGTLLVYDSDTERIVYKQNEEILGAKEEELSPLLKSWDEESGVVRNIRGKKYFITCHRSSFMGWDNYMLIPYGEMMEGMQFLIVVCIGLILLFAAVAILVTARLAKYFLKNITSLTNSVERVSAEHLKIEPPITSGDEVERLYDSFERMAARLTQEIEEKKESEREKLILEQQALQAQIKPHFLYNTLYTIKLIAGMMEAEPIVDMTSALSTIMQSNMSKEQFHTFSEARDYLEKYMCIREYQYVGEIIFSCEVEEGLEQCLVLKMLIQPLVENSLKHGHILDKENGRVEVRIFRQEETVRVSVFDNGDGMDESVRSMVLDQRAEGIGLANVARRIRLYHGQDYGMEIESEPGAFTRVTLLLPLIERDDRS